MTNLDDRLRVAYATAMKQRQGPGIVQIHIGADVFAYLRNLAKDVAAPGTPGNHLWGFPLVHSRQSMPDHISVHTVEVIG